MSWSDPSLLALGAALTALVLVGLWSHGHRRRALAEFLGGRRAMVRLSRPDLRGFGLRRSLLLGVAGLALAAAAAEPRWVDAPPPEPEVKRVVLALDVSASMQAEDESPTRLARAVAVTREILDSLDGHEVGLMLFAGSAYPLAPPTLDHHAVGYLLDGVTARTASAQDPGTLVSVAIDQAVALLSRVSDPEEAPDPLVEFTESGAGTGERLVVLIGDGDAGEPEAEVAAAVASAREAGITVHTIGVGTEEGAGMTMPSGTYQLSGPVVDPRGRPGLTRLREPLLRTVAETGGGRYARADVAADLRAVHADLLAPSVDPGAGRAGAGPGWARYDLSFLLGAVALALVLVESLLGMSPPRLRLPRAGEVA